jgi:hypothetical protein
VVRAAIRKLRVEVNSVDEILHGAGIQIVDFVKLDVEGAELDVLRGATNLLHSKRRPVILAEVYDMRSQPWGYRARDIVAFLYQIDYQWFALREDGTPEATGPDRDYYDANLVAVPRERVSEFLSGLSLR